MTYLSANDQKFLARVAKWIAAQREILVMIRYSAAAGSKDFEFYSSMAAFTARLQNLPPRACVIVFGHRQLPLRGKVDDEFIRQASALVLDGEEFLIVGSQPVTYGKLSWLPKADGSTHAALHEALSDVRGEAVAVGQYPHWLNDGEDVISALVPDADGAVTPGIY